MDFLDPKFLLGKMDHLFGRLKCADKLNVAFGFAIKNVKEGSCWYYFARKTKTLLEWIQLFAAAENLTKMNNLPCNTVVLESCTKDEKIYKLINVTFSAAWLKENPMGCRDVLLLDPLVKNPSVKCLTLAEKNPKNRIKIVYVSL